MGSREWTEDIRLDGKHLDSLNHSYGLIYFILSWRFMVIWFNTGHCPLGVGWSSGTTYRRGAEWARDLFLEQQWNPSLFLQRPKQSVIAEHRRPQWPPSRKYICPPRDLSLGKMHQKSRGLASVWTERNGRQWEPVFQWVQIGMCWHIEGCLLLRSLILQEKT